VLPSARLGADPAARQASSERASLLTPAAKAFGTGTLLAEEALAASRLPAEAAADPAARIAIARFFAEHIAVQARGLERAVIEGADSVTGADAALAV
jgi:acyl-CoA dehydrogenase